MNITINSEIVVAYAQCPRQAYLLLHSNKESKVKEFISIIEHQKSLVRNEYVKNLKQQYSDVQPYEDRNFRNGSSFLIGGKLKSEGFEAACGILEKVLLPSSLGEYSYEPKIFVGTHKINNDQRLELIFIGHILGQIQGRSPVAGKIISAELKSHKIRLEGS